MGNKILHITPHLGGGAGSVILNWMDKDMYGNIHAIISLDMNNNNDWIKTNEQKEKVTIYDDCFRMDNFGDFLNHNIMSSDVVLIHWWNHPLLYEIIVNYDLPKNRMILWNHASSLFPPYTMSEKLVDFSDYLIFTSPISYNCEEIKSLAEIKKNKLDVIWSTVGVEEFNDIKKTPHDGFIVGYTGTVDFGKLHPSFIKMCSQVKPRDIKFIVCSGDSQQHLIDEAKKIGVSDKFIFKGRVPSVIPYLAKFDVFGYPLQPHHFATCEQSIGEAMAAGVVPVVLNNATECIIVRHNETGLIANTLEEYADAIEYLYNNPSELKRLSDNAREYAKKTYDIKDMFSKWQIIFDKVMMLEKKSHNWGFNRKLLPHEIYIESLGNYSKPLVDHINAKTANNKLLAEEEIKKLFNRNSMFRSSSKGSVLQYLQFFKDDKYLLQWANLLK